MATSSPSDGERAAKTVELYFVPVAGDVLWDNPLPGAPWLWLIATPYEASSDRYVVDSVSEITFYADGTCVRRAKPERTIRYSLEGRVLQLESNYFLVYAVSKDEILLQPLVGSESFSLFIPVGQTQVLLRGEKRAAVVRRTD
ncbi:hypothetical protein [Salinispira pacifica]